MLREWMRWLVPDLAITRRFYLVVFVMAAAAGCSIAVAAWQVQRQLYAAKVVEARHLARLAASLAADDARLAASGALPASAALRRALHRLSRLRYGSGGYAWGTDLAGALLTHPTVPQFVGVGPAALRDAGGPRPFGAMTGSVARQADRASWYRWPPGANAGARLDYAEVFDGWLWIIGADVNLAGAQTVVHAAVLHQALATALILGMALVFVTAVAHCITAPLAALPDATRQLAAGDLTIAEPGQGRADEFGGMAAAGRVVDASAGGAQMGGAAAMRPDDSGALLLDGAAPLPFVVRSIDERGSLHVAFVTDDVVRGQVTAWLARLAASSVTDELISLKDLSGAGVCYDAIDDLDGQVERGSRRAGRRP